MRYVPRDIGCNRYPVYEEGKWVRDEVHDGFNAKDLDDLIEKLYIRYPNPGVRFTIEPDTSAPNSPSRIAVVKDEGFVIGWVDRA